MKAVKGKLEPGRVGDFEKGAAAYAKTIVANFKDFEFVGDMRVPRFFQELDAWFFLVYGRGHEP
jgi:hypothetical protein